MNPQINTDTFYTTQLAHPGRKVDVVLDTDTYNEVDDQFALAYCALSPEHMDLKAIYAAPFHNGRSNGPEDGMEKSYDEILRLLERMNMSPDGFVYKGSRSYMSGPDTPVDSPAAKDLVERAKQYSPDNPLYVLPIGAPTNVSSAIVMDPSIINNIVIVWLGGQPLDWMTAKEFNLKQDLHASRVLYDSGVPLVQIPCANVAEHLRTCIPELADNIAGHNALCDFLHETVVGYTDNPKGWSKVIWDISVVAWLINPNWVPSALTQSPILTDQVTYSRDPNRHLIRVAWKCDRDAIFRDMFAKITAIA